MAGVGLLLLLQAVVNAWLLTQGIRMSCLIDLRSNHLIFVVSIAVIHNQHSGVHGKPIVSHLQFDL